MDRCGAAVIEDGVEHRCMLKIRHGTLCSASRIIARKGSYVLREYGTHSRIEKETPGLKVSIVVAVTVLKSAAPALLARCAKAKV